MNPKQKHTQIVKSIANDLGFLNCGIAKARFLESEADRLEQWLKANKNGRMAYMENHFDKRLNPQLLVPGSKSVISLLYNYYPIQQQRNDSYKIAKYAYGEDYHFVIKDLLKEFLRLINTQIGEVRGRVFVDSAPVMEKAWAAKAGLGWVGKNTNLITKKQGSFYFIAELILDLELDYDNPVTDHCGKCTACIDACPTDALTPYTIDASKCISYATIELKDDIPSSFDGKMDDWMFGCDICQDVCPWNRFSLPHTQQRFSPTQEKLNYTKAQWQELTQELFSEIFRKSAVKRTKYKGLMRNINRIKENVPSDE